MRRSVISTALHALAAGTTDAPTYEFESSLVSCAHTDAPMCDFESSFVSCTCDRCDIG